MMTSWTIRTYSNWHSNAQCVKSALVKTDQFKRMWLSIICLCLFFFPTSLLCKTICLEQLWTFLDPAVHEFWHMSGFMQNKQQKRKWSLLSKRKCILVNIHLLGSAATLDHGKVYRWLTVGFKTFTQFSFDLAIWSVISFLGQFALHCGSCHYSLEAPLPFLNILLWMKNDNINLGHVEHAQRHRST